jgi:hypothetical protein
VSLPDASGLRANRTRSTKSAREAFRFTYRSNIKSFALDSFFVRFLAVRVILSVEKAAWPSSRVQVFSLAARLLLPLRGKLPSTFGGSTTMTAINKL